MSNESVKKNVINFPFSQERMIQEMTPPQFYEYISKLSQKAKEQLLSRYDLTETIIKNKADEYNKKLNLTYKN